MYLEIDGCMILELNRALFATRFDEQRLQLIIHTMDVIDYPRVM